MAAWERDRGQRSDGQRLRGALRRSAAACERFAAFHAATTKENGHAAVRSRNRYLTPNWRGLGGSLTGARQDGKTAA